MSKFKKSLRGTLAASVAGCAWAAGVCANRIYTAVTTPRSDAEDYPSPFGLMCGLGSVAIAQGLLVIYQRNRRISEFEEAKEQSIQLKQLSYKNSFVQDVFKHVKRVELLLLVPYLSLTWMFNLMPASYYNVSAPPSALDVLTQLLLVDFFTYTFHVVLHTVSNLYVVSHKAHHKFTNPQLFNAFDATVVDTIFLILFPLFATANICHVNCYSYVVFGVLYSSHFMLIHSEFEHVFDRFLGQFGVMTAADHHVHHAKFNWNFGHFFKVYDWLGGTYKSPSEVKGFRAYAKEEN